MKTRRIGSLGIAVLTLSIALILYLSAQSCRPLSLYPLLAVISFQIIAVALVFGVFLKLGSKQITSLKMSRQQGKFQENTGRGA